MKRNVPILAENAFETKRAVCETMIGANVGESGKRKRGFGEDWRETKRIKMELQQVDIFIKQIDEVCKQEGISEPKVPVNQTIDDLIADIDKAIIEAQNVIKAMFGDEKDHAPNPKLEMKKETAMKPIKIDEERSKKMKPLVSPLPKKIEFKPDKPCDPVTRVGMKRKTPEEKTLVAEEKPKKKFKFIPVSFP